MVPGDAPVDFVRIRLQEHDPAELAEQRKIARLRHDPAPSGDDVPVRGSEQRFQSRGFAIPKRRLTARTSEDLRYRRARPVLHEMVRIEELEPQFLGNKSSHARLSRSHEPDQDYVISWRVRHARNIS